MTAYSNKSPHEFPGHRATAARTCTVGPRFVAYLKGKAADIQNRSALPSCSSIVHSALILAMVILAASVLMAKDPPGKLELKTTAFRAGGSIPTRFTCSGENISPALAWNQAPPRTQSFVLIVDDPDAPGGTWVHWVVYNLPASARQLPEHVPPGDSIAGGSMQGLNDFPQNGYGGPCPPPGKPHRYFFRLYALDTILNPHPPVHRVDIDITMKGHILAQAEWMGTFAR